MDCTDLFIKEQSEYRKQLDKLNGVFKLGQEFPNQVFKKQYSYFMFTEFDRIMEGGFGKVLGELNSLSDDSASLFVTLNPDPLTYFYREFGFFNWAEIPAVCLPTYYFGMLESGPESSPADAVLFNSFQVALTGDSGKWAIYGDRDWEIAIIGFKEKEHWMQSVPLLSTWQHFNQKELEWYKTNLALNEKVLNLFLQNYSLMT